MLVPSADTPPPPQINFFIDSSSKVFRKETHAFHSQDQVMIMFKYKNV